MISTEKKKNYDCVSPSNASRPYVEREYFVPCSQFITYVPKERNHKRLTTHPLIVPENNLPTYRPPRLRLHHYTWLDANNVSLVTLQKLLQEPFYCAEMKHKVQWLKRSFLYRIFLCTCSSISNALCPPCSQSFCRNLCFSPIPRSTSHYPTDQTCENLLDQLGFFERNCQEGRNTRFTV